MTPKEDRAQHQNRGKWADGGGQQAEERELERPSPERTRAANEVGSAIAHQLNGPLTALRLYVGEIRQNSGRLGETADAQGNLQQMVEGAFQETERICAMMRLIADNFEGPLSPETAAALGRDVIGWWSRSGSPEGSRDENGPTRVAPSQPIHEPLTPREQEVLNHVSQGCSNKQGARRMLINPRTFESHRSRVMRKLGARNAADLVRMALGENLVTS
jgi:DNA-binding CsgD family transcriptional regulator